MYRENEIEITFNWNPNPNGTCLIKLRKTHSEDLWFCKGFFSQILLHHDSTATLEDTIVPVSIYEETVDTIKKIKELTGTTILFYYEDSTTIPCDRECAHAVASLRAVQITIGSTWYCREGAEVTNKIHNAFFRSRVDEEYIRAFDVKNSFGIEMPLHFTKYEAHFISTMKTRVISPEVYTTARSFLEQMKIDDLQIILRNLIDYNKIREVSDVLNSTIEFINASGRSRPVNLEELQWNMDEIYVDENYEHDDPNIQTVHDLIHNIRDCFSQNKNSMYLTFAVSKMMSITTSTMMRVAIMTQILTDIPMLDVSGDIANLEKELESLQNNVYSHLYSRDIFSKKYRLNYTTEYSTKTEAQIVYDLLFGDIDIIHQRYRSLYNDYLDKRKDKWLRSLETQSSSTGIALISNTNENQRKQWRKFSCDRGIDNYMDALIPAVNLFAQLSISQFNDISPEFFANYAHRLPESIGELLINPSNFNLHYLFSEIESASSADNLISFLNDMLLSLKKPLSDNVVLLINDYEKQPENFMPDEAYIVWSIAKIVMDQEIIFGFE